MLGACLVAMLLVAGCVSAGREGAGAVELERHEFMRVCMGVPTRIVVYGEDAAAVEEAAAMAFHRISELDAVMSDYRRDSDLNKLCDRAGGPGMVVPSELVEVLGLAGRVSAASGGAFDVTVGPSVALWREARRSGKLPDAGAVDAARGLVDWRWVEVEGERVRLSREGMKLDLGGIAKGYAAERAVRVLKERGFSRCMVGMAGDIVAGEPPPGKQGWRVAVVGERAPAGEREAPGEGRMVVVLANAAISTSGDAEQFVELEGKRYSHIVDPRTGLGMTAIRAVTVVARTGEEADSLATAACLVGEEAAREMLRSWGGVGAVFEERGERRVFDPTGMVRVDAR